MRGRSKNGSVGALFAATLFLSASAAFAQDYTFTTLADPLGVNGTVPFAISGNSIVGIYKDASGNAHGFLYNGSTYTTIDAPNATNTYITGISGDALVGYYSTASGGNSTGFIYDGSTFQTITVNVVAGPLPNLEPTRPTGISGSNVVGINTSSEAFLYNGTTSSVLQLPYAPIEGISIDGNELAGSYVKNLGTYYGFFYNGSTYTDINDPLASYASVGSTGGFDGTFVGGVSGSNVVGSYFDAQGHLHGFLYSSGSFVTIDEPDAYAGGIQGVTGIDGTTLVGTYQAANGMTYGYEAFATPEPRAILLALLGVASFGLLRFARSK